jgi:hypothetical protein
MKELEVGKVYSAYNSKSKTDFGIGMYEGQDSKKRFVVRYPADSDFSGIRFTLKNGRLFGGPSNEDCGYLSGKKVYDKNNHLLFDLTPQNNQ